MHVHFGLSQIATPNWRVRTDRFREVIIDEMTKHLWARLPETPGTRLGFMAIMGQISFLALLSEEMIL